MRSQPGPPPAVDVAVFTYERPALLLNLLASIATFLPEARTTVYDDGSVGEDQRELLRRIAGRFRVEARPRDANDRHGGLYGRMNEAVDNSIRRGAGFLLLLQDDMQLVRSCADRLHDQASSMSQHADALMAGVSFDKWMYPSFRERCSCCDAQVLKGRALFDVGLLDVGKFSRFDLRFGPDEIEANRAALSVGAKAYVFDEPIAAFVPWPKVHRHAVTRRTPRLLAGGSSVSTSRLRRFLAEGDVDVAEVDRLLLHESPCRSVLDDGTDRYFHETNLSTVGWRAVSPFGFGEDGAFWARGLARNWFRNDGRPRLKPGLSRRVERWRH